MITNSNGDKALYLEAPNKPNPTQQVQLCTKSIFLAGGITGCYDWQAIAAKRLAVIKDLLVINPRRTNWDINDQAARQLLFWFSNETVQPITLYELGRELGKRQETLTEGYPYAPIFIGVDTRYSRAFDVREQLKYIARDIPIYHDLHGMLTGIIQYNLTNEALRKASEHRCDCRQ